MDKEYLLPFERMERKILVKKESETSQKFGANPNTRPVAELLTYAVVNIDKPAGPTSHQISAYVKDILHAGKAGHSGTLDPGVTGVLPTGINKATRIMQWLLTAGKEYICLMHLHEEVPKDKVINAMKKYTGAIMQLPPIKSAVKRQIRERNVYYVEIIDIDEKDVLFRIGCQAGTYIRKWVHDFGQSIGINAHMVELRRTKAGPFTENNLTTLQDLADAYHYYKNENNESYLRKIFITPESSVSHLRKIYVMDTTVDSLCHGAFLKVPGIVKLEEEIEKDDVVAIFTLKEELILIGRALMSTSDIMKSEKGVATKTEQVFMDPGVYPKIEK